MLQASKLAKLREMVGESKEEEKPEGEVAGPSEEAIVHSSGNAPLFKIISSTI